MIGVVAEPHDLPIAGEFFELFKTPWEPAVPGRAYQAVLATSGDLLTVDAKVALVYGSTERDVDSSAGVTVRTVQGPIPIEFGNDAFPVYGDIAHFHGTRSDRLLTSSGQSVLYRNGSEQRTIWRIGYDLFAETRRLLCEGQPAVYAAAPTLELHIAVVRRLLLESQIPFVEIPPRPCGYDFTCCLTHDLDFFGIRRHRADATLAGFLARASFGTLADWLLRRRPASEAVRNWRALASLPFVFLGMTKDPWHPVHDYQRKERGRRSTYFVIPFKGRAGVSLDGTIDGRRAVKYQASEVGDELRLAAAEGSEIAVHGIDAWRDAEAGRREKDQILGLTGERTAGVRMHWLYFAPTSPVQLEQAGFAYDSTWGYNDAIGYRAGTAQVFRLPNTRNLMELPLSIMDTAMLFRDRMNLRRDDALQRCFRIVTDMRRFGGTLVINWHDRSLAPERLWGQTYDALLSEVTAGPVWFATAGEAVDWYKWRRSIRFTYDSGCRVTVTADARDRALPGARVVCRPKAESPRELSYDREPVTVDL